MREELQIIYTDRLMLPGDDPGVADFLRRYEEEPWRHYHTLAHIEQMTHFLLDRETSIADMPSVLLATLGHDVVYDPTVGDGHNEQLSAVLTLESFADKQPAERLRKASAYMLATISHQWNGSDRDLGYFLDADMSILAADPDVFDAYDEAIAQEYAHIEPDVFRKGRAVFLAEWAEDEKAIFAIPEIRDELEHKAKANLARTLLHYESKE